MLETIFFGENSLMINFQDKHALGFTSLGDLATFVFYLITLCTILFSGLINFQMKDSKEILGIDFKYKFYQKMFIVFERISIWIILYVMLVIGYSDLLNGKENKANLFLIISSIFILIFRIVISSFILYWNSNFQNIKPEETKKKLRVWIFILIFLLIYPIYLLFNEKKAINICDNINKIICLIVLFIVGLLIKNLFKKEEYRNSIIILGYEFFFVITISLSVLIFPIKKDVFYVISYWIIVFLFFLLAVLIPLFEKKEEKKYEVTLFDPEKKKSKIIRAKKLIYQDDLVIIYEYTQGKVEDDKSLKIILYNKSHIYKVRIIGIY